VSANLHIGSRGSRSGQYHRRQPRPHYDNIRANVVYSRLDRRGRGRLQISAELPLMYTASRRHTPPEVNFPTPREDSAEQPRKKRPSALEPTPFLQSIPAYRYIKVDPDQRRLSTKR